MSAFAAVDLGAASGRVIRGDLAGGRLTLVETARFANGPVPRDGRLRWDLPRLLAGVEDGIRAAAAAGPLAGVGADAWGVDFGLLDAAGELIEWPTAYRDPRTEGVAERFFEKVPWVEVYDRTGVQLLPFNTLFQLHAMARAGDPALGRAKRLLMIPDLVHHHLAGSEAGEFTNATTTQCLSAGSGAWDRDLVAAAGADPGILPDLVPPGTVLGTLTEGLAPGGVPVIAPATHDTASAVAAVPAEGGDWAFLSSGTWSLLGLETPAPVLTPAAREANLTNEGGAFGTNRLLRNVMGLWLLQRLREELGKPSWAELAREAEAAPPGGTVDPDDPDFLNPPCMAEALAAACRRAGKPVPQTRGAFARLALTSLARRYAEVLDRLRTVSGREVHRLHVVGGGAQNALLNRLTAAATGLPVIAGPVEATAAGNVLLQAAATGRLASPAEVREIVRASFDLVTFAPEEGTAFPELCRS